MIEIADSPCDDVSASRTVELNQDRRLYHRFPIGRHAALLIDGQTHDCLVMDLSLGGARIEPGSLADAGSVVQLQLDDLEPDLIIRSEVVQRSTKSLNLRFLLDELTEAALVMHLMTDPATLGAQQR